MTFNPDKAPMLKNGIFAAFVAIGLVSAPVRAQYTYNWSTGEEGDQVIRAARVATLHVSGLNTMCYDFLVHAEVSDEKPVLTGLLDSFSPPQATQQPKHNESSTQGGTTSPTEALSNPNLRRQLGLRRVTVSEDQVVSRVAEAEIGLEAAAPSIASLAAATDRASFYLDLLKEPPCDRSFDASGFFSTWNREREGLLRQIRESGDVLDVVRRRVSTAETALTNARRLAEQLTASSPKAVLLQRITADQQRQDSLGTILSRLTAALPDIQARLPTAAIQLDSYANSANRSIRADLGPEAASIKLTITGTERHPAEGKSAQKIEETHAIGVRRKYQSFLSTGLLVMLGSPHDYARVNRPYPQGDSTYSTFANQAGGVLNVFSPALQFNIAVADFADAATHGTTFGMPLYLSLGAAGRSVNGRALPEPFAGLSFGVADRFLVTFGVHYGRDEVLLIRKPGETDQDVAARRIPAAVTDKDAVGEKWESNGFLSFSVRF